MALAAVVSVLAVTKRISVMPKAVPTIREDGRHHHRQQPGSSSNKTTAARPDRKQAICQLDNELSLIAVPPVANSNAVMRTKTLETSLCGSCEDSDKGTFAGKKGNNHHDRAREAPRVVYRQRATIVHPRGGALRVVCRWPRRARSW